MLPTGPRQLNEGELFGSLLSYAEALRLDAGSSHREEGHRIRIASVLRQCPKLVGMFAHGTAPINDAAFSPNAHRVVTAGDDHTAQMWDLDTHTLQLALQHNGPVYSVGFSPDGDRLVTTSPDGIRFWDSHSGQPLRTAPIRHRAWYNGPSPLFSPDGLQLLTLKDKQTVANWNVVTGESLGKPLRHNGEVTAFAFSPDSRRILTVSQQREAHLWDASSGELLCRFQHQAEVNCGAFSNDGKIVATCGDDSVTKFWDVDSGKEIAPSIAHWHSVDFLAFSPDGGRLVTASDKTVQLWDVATRRPLLRPLVHEQRVVRVDFSPEGRWLAVCTEGNRVRLYDTDTGELLPPPLVHDTPRRPVIFSPDGHLVLTLEHDLALGREETAVVWSLAGEGAPRLKIPPSTSFRKRPSRSADGRFEANVTGDTVRPIVVSSGKALTQPLKQNIPFRQAVFSSDNSLLITENIGARGQLWDTVNGEPLTPLLPIDYDTNAQAVTKADLPHDAHPANDLLELAELLSGNRIDETGGFRPLDAEAQMERWSALKRANPEALSDSLSGVLAWHERQATLCEQAWNWWPAVFHLKYLLAMRPGDSKLQKRLAYVRSALDNATSNAAGYTERRFSVIPPRNPEAGSEMIDLSQFYNFSKRGGEDSMASLPSGLQIFDGTPFDVRGVVQLSDQSGSSLRFRKEVQNIQVNRTCRRLHFLHATASQSPVDSQEVSSYLIHYADQRTQCITNVYGRDLRSWWTTSHEPLNASKAALVWIGTNRQAESGDAESVRMFKRSWDNPWPDVEVTSIDFFSNGKGVGPFLVALTAE